MASLSTLAPTSTSTNGTNGSEAKTTKVLGEKRKQPLANLDEWEDVKKPRTDEQDDEDKEAKTEVDDLKVVPGDETKALVDDELGKPKAKFRNYVDSAQQARITKFYTEQHKEMTHDVVKALEKKYLSLDKEKLGIWDAMEYLCSLVDASDPDTDLSQMQHALQTAESIRKKYPGEEYDWFHVVGLIHDLGKILSLSPKMMEPQWCVVGDTFPVGCAFSDKIVFPHTFDANPDRNHPVYSTKNGVYSEGCGLKNVTMSWGHDEYLYQVCVRNGSTLPDPALYMIRYHSFYPWHKEGAYGHLLDDKDREMLKWVKEFNQFDLYSKADSTYDPVELAVYYKKAILKYFPAIVNW
jgi:inositol oxygenase